MSSSCIKGPSLFAKTRDEIYVMDLVTDRDDQYDYIENFLIFSLIHKRVIIPT